MADQGRRSPLSSSGAAVTSLESGPAEVIQEVFLSPRVVDREAFNDFSGSLRKLIEEAAEQRAALREAAAGATTAQQALKDAAGKNQPKLEAAIRALQLLDQRAGDAERALSAALEASAGLQAARDEILDLARQKGDELAERIGSLVSAGEARLTTVLERAEATARARFDELESRARAAEERLAKLLEHAESAASRLGEQAETRVTHAEARLTRKMAELEAWSADFLRRCEDRVAEEQDRAAATGQDLMRQAADAHAQAESISADLRVLITRGESLTAPDAPGSLSAAIKSAMGLRDETARAASEAARSIEHARAASAELADSIAAHSDQIDHLSEVSESLREAVARTLKAAADAEAGLEKRQHALRAAITIPLVELNSIGDELRNQLASILAQAQQQHAASKTLREQTGEIMLRLDELVTRLEPWRPLLLEGATDVPAPIRDLIQSVRTELGADLRTIAAAMSDVSTRASRLAGGPGR